MVAVDRYLPERSFPPYTYVPGAAPHPIRDPAGHMYGHVPATFVLNVEDWRACPDYLWGIDLFNHGFYWEAHEAWEGLWHVAGRAGPTADFLKGLIKLAAAGVKSLEGNLIGRQRHLRRAVELLAASAIATQGRCMGLELHPLCNAVATCMMTASKSAERAPRNSGPAVDAAAHLRRPAIEHHDCDADADVIVPHASRSRRLSVGLLLVLVLVLALGGWLLLVRLSGPQPIELTISEPVGEDVYYDVLLDDAASSGVATVPATLTFHGRHFAIAVIPRGTTTADLDVSFTTPQGGGSRHGSGAICRYDHSGFLSSLSLEPMTAVHIANMRRARRAAEATTEK